MRRRSALGALLVLAVAIGVLVQRAWPQPANPGLRQSLDALRGSPVPVFVVVPQQPRETHGTIEADGFTYTIVRGDPLIIRGRRSRAPDAAPARSGPGELTWSQGGVTYTITAESDLRDGTPAGLMERVTPLDVALRQNWGFAGDTPLLYLAYVPVLAGFGVWACWRLILAGDWRARRPQEADGANA